MAFELSDQNSIGAAHGFTSVSKIFPLAHWMSLIGLVYRPLSRSSGSLGNRLKAD